MTGTSTNGRIHETAKSGAGTPRICTASTASQPYIDCLYRANFQRKISKRCLTDLSARRVPSPTTNFFSCTKLFYELYISNKIPFTMGLKPKGGPSAHETSTSPSYPMGPFSTGGSSYTNTVPEEADESQQQHRGGGGIAGADLSDSNTYPPPQEAPPMYAPPNRHPPGHGPAGVGSYGSQQHLVQDAPAHPPPAYSKYTTAAQARWARSSRIAKLLCILFLIAIVVIIVVVAAAVSLTRGGSGGPNNNGSNPGFGGGPGSGGPGSGSDCADFGNKCSGDADCSSGFCRLAFGTCGC